MKEDFYTNVNYVLVTCVVLNLLGPCFLILGLMNGDFSKAFSIFFTMFGTIVTIFYAIYLLIFTIKKCTKEDNVYTQTPTRDEDEDVVLYTDINHEVVENN
jgi:predicted membrane protein